MQLPPSDDESKLRRLRTWSARHGFGPKREAVSEKIYKRHHQRAFQSLGVIMGIRDPARGWSGDKREVRVRNGMIQASRPGKGNPWIDVVEAENFARRGRRAIYF